MSMQSKPLVVAKHAKFPETATALAPLPARPTTVILLNMTNGVRVKVGETVQVLV